MSPVDEKTLDRAREALALYRGTKLEKANVCLFAQALLDQQAELAVLRDFAQKCVDITCSVIEGDTRLQSGERLWEYVRSWPHWKDGLLHIDGTRLDAWRKDGSCPSAPKTLRPFEIRRASAEGELLGHIEALNTFEAAIIAAQEFFSRPAAFREPGSAGAAGVFRAWRGKDDGGELFFVREALPSRQG